MEDKATQIVLDWKFQEFWSGWVVSTVQFLFDVSIVLMWLSHYQWSKIINEKIRELQRVETSLGQVMQLKIL